MVFKTVFFGLFSWPLGTFKSLTIDLGGFTDLDLGLTVDQISVALCGEYFLFLLEMLLLQDRRLFAHLLEIGFVEAFFRILNICLAADTPKNIQFLTLAETTSQLLKLVDLIVL